MHTVASGKKTAVMTTRGADSAAWPTSRTIPGGGSMGYKTPFSTDIFGVLKGFEDETQTSNEPKSVVKNSSELSNVLKEESRLVSRYKN